MVQSTVYVSMRDENDLKCSYAIVRKSGVSVLIILRDSECAIVDYDKIKKENEYRYLLMKHYADDSKAYIDFLKLIGKMCKKRRDSKYFLNHIKEDNRMVYGDSGEEHMICEEEKGLYEERYKIFERFVLDNRMRF